MKAYYEVETFKDALDLTWELQKTADVGIKLVQNVYKSDLDGNCIVIKFKR